MRYTPIIFVFILLLTACGCSDASRRHQIIGTWSQPGLTLTFASDGTCTSVFQAAAIGQTNFFDGTWRLSWGRLVLTELHSNNVPVSAVSYIKIQTLDEHRLVFDDQLKNSFSR